MASIHLPFIWSNPITFPTYSDVGGQMAEPAHLLLQTLLHYWEDLPGLHPWVFLLGSQGENYPFKGHIKERLMDFICWRDLLMYILPYLLLSLIFPFSMHHSWWSWRSINEKQKKNSSEKKKEVWNKSVWSEKTHKRTDVKKHSESIPV